MEICRSILNADRTAPGVSNGVIPLFSPEQTQAQHGLIEFNFVEIPLAIEWARDCFKAQKELGSPGISREDLQRAKAKLSEVRERLVLLAKEESGRTRHDFELEVRSLQDYLEAFIDAYPGLQGCIPRGVSVVIGSSVWPIFYGTQTLLMNLFAGNSVILKPSEKVTRIVLEWVRALRDLGGPLQMIQVVVGEKETGRRLVCHEDVDLVVFQGAYETGMRVRQDTLSNPGKEVLLFLGAKNPVILNREPDESLCRRILQDAFLCAGQHCLSTPLLFVQSSHLEATRRGILAAYEKMVSLDDAGDFWFGALQDQARLERYLKFVHVLEREGATLERKGNRDRERLSSCFASATVAVFPTLEAHRVRKMESFQVEVLGPHLSIVPFENVSALEELLNGLSYGLVSPYFGDPDEIKGFLRRHQLGTIALNLGSFELGSWEAPLARKRSGNHGRLGFHLLDLVSLDRIPK